MMTTIFWGLTPDQWNALNVIGTWLSGLASLGAVIVALNLANRASRPRARVTVRAVIKLVGPGTSPPRQYIAFGIVNSGERVLKIESIGWRRGIFRKKYLMQMFDRQESSPMPIELAHGQTATWYVPVDSVEGHEPWHEYFVKVFLPPTKFGAIRSLRGQFYTSIGYSFYSKLCRPTTQNFKDALSSVRKSKQC
jgi:hypothetical protein